jgi:NADPH:quinone reductase-like Zn-dependent oxidoreductase
MKGADEHRDAHMKAVIMERYGRPDVLGLREVTKRMPKAGEVLVRVRAASVNDRDWGLLRGKPFMNRLISGVSRPKVRVIGGDIAGCVEAVGDDVGCFKPDDEVYGDLWMNGFGAFAEYACAPEACLARKPAGMTFEQAAAIPQAGMLAVQGLIDTGRIQSGQTLLLNGRAEAWAPSRCR